LRNQIKPTLDVGAKSPKWKHLPQYPPPLKTTEKNRYLTMDLRKKDNPKNWKLTLRTDEKTSNRLKEEAKQRGVSVSQHLNDKLSK
jgi:hypothetical protein